MISKSEISISFTKLFVWHTDFSDGIGYMMQKDDKIYGQNTEIRFCSRNCFGGASNLHTSCMHTEWHEQQTYVHFNGLDCQTFSHT